MSEEAMAPADEAGQAESGESSALQFSASTMPEGLRDEPSLQTFDSVDKLAKSYVNAVKKIGANPDNLISLPQEGESWDNLFNQIGRPEKPDGYDFGDDEGVLDDFREFAHQTGLSQDQAENILNLFGDIQEEEKTQRVKEIEDLALDTKINLQKEWGNKYEGKIDMATRAFAQFSSPELKSIMNETGLGNHPEMIRAFSKIGEILGEDSLVVGTGMGSTQFSPQQARVEIQNLYSDKEFSEAYRDNRNSGHKSAMNKMDKLFKTAYPNQKRVR